MKKPRGSKISLKLSHQKADWFLIVLVLGLTIFGLTMIYNASAVEAYRDFSDKLYYFRLQLQWAGLGLLGFIFASFFDYRRLRPLAIPLLIVSLFSLGLVLIPGLGTKVLGAQRWLSLGIFRFQPAELAKLAFVLYLAAFMSQKKSLWPFLILLTVLIGLTIAEPDLGTAVIIAATGLVVYFASGAPLIWIGLIGIIGLIGGLGLIFSSTYRKERILTFINPARDPLGASYHIHQILLALGSGGLLGLGLGQSRQKYEYLPAAATDSIFAIIAEELGFVGAVGVVIIFLLLIWRGFKIAKEAPDKFGSLLATGIISWIGFQTLINLSAIVALVPLTGVPLPFISYGGSSLVLIMTASGILVNISKQRKVEK